MITSKFVVQLIGLYIFANVLVWLIANKQIFLPPKSTYQDSSAILKIPVNDKKISAMYLPNPQAKYVVIYSHGNAEDLGMLKPILQEMQRWGLAVISYDYQGYGTSDGSPNEAATYADINAVYAFLIEQQKISPQQIIVYGRSLGSGPSVELAAHKPIAGLILESSLISAYRVITYYPIFFPDKYNNLGKLKNIQVPILFIHGENDHVIPIWHSKVLFKNYAGPKHYEWLPNVGHNDIDYYDAKHKRIILDFIASLKDNQDAAQ